MKRRRRILSRFVLLFALVTTVSLAVLGWYGSSRLLSPPRRALHDYHREILATPADYGLAIHQFSTGDAPCLMVTAAKSPRAAAKSRELRAELRRRGARIPRWDASIGTIVMLHGHGGRKEDHLPICERFCAAGFRCLLLDLPGQGDHPESVGTFGFREANLAEKVLEQAARRYGFDSSSACLFGISQGGAIALQAAAHSPEKWCGIVTVAAFSSLDHPVRRAAESTLPTSLRPLSPLATFAVSCATKCRAGFWLGDIRPVEAARRLSLPVCVVHGDADRYIPIDQAREIHAALPGVSKRLRVVDGGDHSRILAIGSVPLYADLCQFFIAAVETSASRSASAATTAP